MYLESSSIRAKLFLHSRHQKWEILQKKPPSSKTTSFFRRAVGIIMQPYYAGFIYLDLVAIPASRSG